MPRWSSPSRVHRFVERRTRWAIRLPAEGFFGERVRPFTTATDQQ